MNAAKLNLLPSLDALLRHTNVTKAAEELGISQSAMSYNLAQLRKLFGDDLFIRTSGGLVATPYARTLTRPLAAVLGDVDKLIKRKPLFNPAEVERSFRIAAPDATEILVFPKVLAWLRREAPGVQVILRPLDEVDVLNDIDNDRLDMAIGVFTNGQTHHKRKLLHNDEYLCLYNKTLLNLPEISLSNYLNTPQLVLTAGRERRDVVGEELAKIGLHRKIAFSTPHLLSTPIIVKNTPIIATVHANPARYFAEIMDLEVCSPPLPLPLPSVPISLLWHSSNDADPCHLYMRNLIVQSVTENFNRQGGGIRAKQSDSI